MWIEVYVDQGVCRSIVRCMLTGEVITCIVENYVGRDVYVRYVFLRLYGVHAASWICVQQADE